MDPDPLLPTAPPRRSPIATIGWTVVVLAVVLGAGVVGWHLMGSAERTAAAQAKREALAGADNVLGARLSVLQEALARIERAMALDPNRGDAELLAVKVALVRAIAVAEERHAVSEVQRSREADHARKVQTLVEEALGLERQGGLEDLRLAESRLTMALSLKPADPNLDAARERIRRLISEQPETEAVRTAQEARSDARRRLDSAELALAQPQPDLAGIISLLREAEVGFARAERLPGTQEDVKRLIALRLRVERAQADAAALAAAERLMAEARALAAAGQPDWTAVQDVARRALEALPLTLADQRQRMLRERDQLAAAAATAMAQRHRQERLVLCRQQLAQAETQLAAGDGDGALTLATQVLTVAPEDAAAEREQALALRDRARAVAAAKAAQAQLAQRIASAERALGWARGHRDAMVGAASRAAAAGREHRQLQRQLASGGVVDPLRLDAAAQRVRSQRTAALTAWESAEHSVREVLETLGDLPGHEWSRAARGVRAELYAWRLAQARTAGQDAEARSWAGLTQRWDEAGRFAAECAGIGWLESGAGAVQAQRLLPAADGGMTPGGPVVELGPGAVAAVPAGTWQVTAGAAAWAVQVGIAATTALAPPSRPPSIPGLAFAWLPPGPDTAGVWLGLTEVPAAILADATAAAAAGQPPLTGIGRERAAAIAAELARRHGLRLRLPTAAELAWAAGGGDPERVHAWGPRLAAGLMVSGWSATSAAAVDAPTRDIGPFGHRHLGGNVREWCGDEPGLVRGPGPQRAAAMHGSHADADPVRFQTGASELLDIATAAPWLGLRLVCEPE